MLLYEFIMLNKKIPFIVSEIGSNHNGNLSRAKKLIYLSKQCGCDAVKFQSFDTDLFSNKIYESNKQLKKEVNKYKLDYSNLKYLRLYAKKLEIKFGTTIFSERDFYEAEKIKCDFIKIASMDLNYDNLINIALKTKKLLIISTGFASEEEINHCVKLVKKTKKKNVVFLHCVAAYPPKKDSDLNLKYLRRLKKISGLNVGFSDHTSGYVAAVTSAFLGATVIEKHFTDNRKLKGWDHSISADPNIMKIIVETTKNFSKFFGKEKKIISKEEIDFGKKMRRSICIYKNIKKGEILSNLNLSCQRPGTGIKPNNIHKIYGKKAKKNLQFGDILKTSDY